MAGSTNFQQWNPSANNQESDAAYATDSQRVGGAPTGATFPSVTGNKLFYQVSTGITALMQMMATKGYVVDDTNIATLAAVLAAIQTESDIRGGLQNLSYSASINCDTAAYTGFEIALSGNTTIAISGGVSGDRILFLFVQDGTGGHTVTWPGNFYGAQQPDPTSFQTTAMLFDRDVAGNYRAAAPAMSSQGTASLAASPASNDNSLRIATTAWALLGFSASLTANGYIKFPTWLGGFTLQWGSASASASSVNVTFPTAFAANCFAAYPVGQDYGSLPIRDQVYLGSAPTTSGVTFATTGSTISVFWLAIGN